jgi:imidazolonepropionase-like amidohydrolase
MMIESREITMTAIAINHAKVYDTETGEFQNKTVLINEEKIEAVFSSTEEVPSHYHLIDGTGKYLTPGLIDTCSQIGLKEKGLRWEGDDSYEPNAKSSLTFNVLDGIYPFDQAFHDAVSAGVTAAHIVSSPGSVIGAQTAVIHTTGKTVDEMVINPKLSYTFSMGDIPKATHWNRTKEPLTRMGIAHKIRKTLLELKKTEDLVNRPVFIRCHRADDIATAHRICEELSIPFILIHGTEYGQVKNPTYKKPQAIIGGPVFQPIERNELKTLSPTLYEDLMKQGIPVTFATDHPTSSTTHLQLEGSLAKKAGIADKEIINGLTKHAAELLKINHLTGSIQEGLYADLVLWNNHPLELTAKAVHTFIKGNEVYKETNNHA